MHQESRSIKHRCLKLMESPGYNLGLLCLPRVGHQFVKGELLGSCMDWELHWHVSHWMGRCSQWIILTNIHYIEGMQSVVNATIHRMGNQLWLRPGPVSARLMLPNMRLVFLSERMQHIFTLSFIFKNTLASFLII